VVVDWVSFKALTFLVSEWVEFNAPLDTIYIGHFGGGLYCVNMFCFYVLCLVLCLVCLPLRWINVCICTLERMLKLNWATCGRSFARDDTRNCFSRCRGWHSVRSSMVGAQLTWPPDLTQHVICRPLSSRQACCHCELFCWNPFRRYISTAASCEPVWCSHMSTGPRWRTQHWLSDQSSSDSKQIRLLLLFWHAPLIRVLLGTK